MTAPFEVLTMERAWLICADPAHAWVRDTWAGQPADPGLPVAGRS